MTAAALSDMWVAHQQPERPLVFGAWLCDCRACAVALRAEVAQRPRRPIIIKTGFDRLTVTAELVLAAIDAGGVEHLMYVPNDYVREVFVAASHDPVDVPWRSLSYDEQIPGSLDRVIALAAKVGVRNLLGVPAEPASVVRVSRRSG